MLSLLRTGTLGTLRTKTCCSATTSVFATSRLLNLKRPVVSFVTYAHPPPPPSRYAYVGCFLSTLKHSHPVFIWYTNSRFRLEFVYQMKIGCSCFNQYLYYQFKFTQKIGQYLQLLTALTGRFGSGAVALYIIKRNELSELWNFETRRKYIQAFLPSYFSYVFLIFLIKSYFFKTVWGTSMLQFS